MASMIPRAAVCAEPHRRGARDRASASCRRRTRGTRSRAARHASSFDHVEFAYPGAEEPVLRDVELHGRAGRDRRRSSARPVRARPPSSTSMPRLFDVDRRAACASTASTCATRPRRALDAASGSCRSAPFLFSGTVASNLRLRRAGRHRRASCGAPSRSPRARPTSCARWTAARRPDRAGRHQRLGRSAPAARHRAGPREAARGVRLRRLVLGARPARPMPGCERRSTRTLPRRDEARRRPARLDDPATPTRSSCSTTAASSASARTTSCSRRCETYREIVESQLAAEARHEQRHRPSELVTGDRAGPVGRPSRSAVLAPRARAAAAGPPRRRTTSAEPAQRPAAGTPALRTPSAHRRARARRRRRRCSRCSAAAARPGAPTSSSRASLGRQLPAGATQAAGRRPARASRQQDQRRHGRGDGTSIPAPGASTSTRWRDAASRARALRVRVVCSAGCRATSSTGSWCSARCTACASRSRTKVQPLCRCRTSTRAARRAAQPRHQRHRQHRADAAADAVARSLTSLLTVIGVLIDDVRRSRRCWRVIALVTVPLTVAASRRRSRQRSQKLFIAAVDAPPGASTRTSRRRSPATPLVKVFGRRGRGRGELRERERGAVRSQLPAPSSSRGMIMPAMMFIGNLDYVRDRGGRRPAGRRRARHRSATCRRSSSTRASSRSRSRQLGSHGEPAAVRASRRAERVFELLDADEQDARRRAAPRPRRTRRGRVEFEDVSFSLRRRQAAHRPTCRSRAEPGQTVAIVGPTGAGKTTPGQPDHAVLRASTSGRITLDGVDIAADDARRPALAHRHGAAGHVAVRRHDPREHRLRRGRRDGRRRSSPPRRPPTSTGSCTRCPTATTRCSTTRRRTLSAGEKQLITIARAFLADPRILILDEATSLGRHPHRGADPAGDVARCARTARLSSSPTALSTIRDADLILVMENGAIVEQGSHDELLRGEGRLLRGSTTPQFEGAAEDEDLVSVPSVPLAACRRPRRRSCVEALAESEDAVE